MKFHKTTKYRNTTGIHQNPGGLSKLRKYSKHVVSLVCLAFCLSLQCKFASWSYDFPILIRPTKNVSYVITLHHRAYSTILALRKTYLSEGKR